MDFYITTCTALFKYFHELERILSAYKLKKENISCIILKGGLIWMKN